MTEITRNNATFSYDDAYNTVYVYDSDAAANIYIGKVIDGYNTFESIVDDYCQNG